MVHIPLHFVLETAALWMDGWLAGGMERMGKWIDRRNLWIEWMDGMKRM